MPQRTFQRVLIVAALLCTLTLAFPPRAHAAPLGGGSDGLWGWLTRLESRISVLLWGDAAPSEKTPSITKQGPGVDPNGGSTPPSAGGSVCSAGSTCDQGPGVDPNG